MSVRVPFMDLHLAEESDAVRAAIARVIDRAWFVLGPEVESFEQEFHGAHDYNLDGVHVKVLPLERVIASKRAAKRAKDSAQLPMLEAALAARNARTADDNRR